MAVSTTTQADPELSAARQAVLAAQQQVDTDLAAAQQALDDAQAVCAAVTAPADPTPDTTASPVPDDSDSSGGGRRLPGIARRRPRRPAGRQRQPERARRRVPGARPAPVRPGRRDCLPWRRQERVGGGLAHAAEVAVAEQAAALASLLSPIAGTVQQVDLAVGDTVSAGSSTAAVVSSARAGTRSRPP